MCLCRSCCVFLLSTMTLSLALSSAAVAYNPPTDSAGPLRVRLVGPSEITRVDTPIAIVVELENQGDRPLSGQVELRVIDGWGTTPDKPERFSIPVRGSTSKSFRVQPGKESYNAQYPVHALVEFQLDGRTLVAHPILILEAKHTRSSRTASRLPWRPVQLSKDSTLALWQIPVRRTVVAVFDREPVIWPVGQSGTEPRSRADVSLAAQTLAGDTRSVIAMHPPWSKGLVGTVAVEYPLALPPEGPITLRFANAMRPDGQSDGVTFRVRVAPLDNTDLTLGTVVFQRHVDAKSWKPAEVDLSRFAGQTIRLQLEAHPGPRNNTGWDRCFWAEPTLVTGTPTPPRKFPPQSTKGSELLGESRVGNAAFEMRFWPGTRGMLDAVIGITDGKKTVHMNGFEITVLQGRLDQPGCSLRLEKIRREEVPNGVQYRHSFNSPFGSFDFVGWLGVEHEVLRARFAIENQPPDRPWSRVQIEDVAIRSWSHSIERVYAGPGNVVVKPEAYKLPFDGHRLSTSFVGYDFEDGFSLIEASDAPPMHLDIRPANRHASLHTSDAQTRTLIPANSVWEGVKRWRHVNGTSAAGGVRQLAGRFVFDLWGGNYAASAVDLRKAFQYGLTDSMVVWHNWQRWGYDYRLPEIYPPNPQFGTPDELKSLIDTCRQAGVLLALHDNYIDYYPDAKGFSYEKKIAFHPDGTPVRAWLNEWRGAQSYRYRSDCIEPILKKNLGIISRELTPTAYFIDVWSSARPYPYWTAGGDYYSAVYTRDTWGQLFAWIRQHLGNDAPQVSESGHDQLIGWLDGAQANHLRVGKRLPGRYEWSVWDWNCADAERIVWFDAAHHDRFVLHGAGYEQRYVAGLDKHLHGMYSDDYIVTEVLTGHPAMASRPFDRDVVRKYWLTHDVQRALALRTLKGVEFADNDIHRQHVRWSGSGHVWVNRGTTDWQTAGVNLPQYGFLARISDGESDVVAAIERRDGVIVERSESPTACYFNARGMCPRGRPDDLALKRRNPHGRSVDFGMVITSSGCRLTLDQGKMLVMPLPSGAAERFDVGIRWSDLPWQLPLPTYVEAIDEQRHVLSRHPIRRDSKKVTISCDGQAFAYRLVN